MNIYFKLTLHNEILFINEHNKFKIDQQNVYSLLSRMLDLERNRWYPLDILSHQADQSLMTLHDKLERLFRRKRYDESSDINLFVTDLFDISADHLFHAKNLIKSESIEHADIVLCALSEYQVLVVDNPRPLYIVSHFQGLYLLNHSDWQNHITQFTQKDTTALTALTIKGIDILYEAEKEEYVYIYKNNQIVKLAAMENWIRDTYFDKNHFYPENKNKDDQVELIQDFYQQMTGKRLEFNQYNQVPYKMITLQQHGNTNYIIGETPFDTLKNAFSAALKDEMNRKAGIKGEWIYGDVGHSSMLEYTVSKLIFLYFFKKGSNIGVAHVDFADIVDKWEEDSFLRNTLMEYKKILPHFNFEISSIMDYEKVIHMKLYRNEHLLLETFSCDFKSTVLEIFKFVIATEIQNSNMNDHVHAVHWSGIRTSQHHDICMEQLFSISYQSEALLNELNLQLLQSYWYFNKRLEGTGINMAKLTLEEI